MTRYVVDASVAAARAFDAPLLTADGPLSRAAGLGIVVQNVRCT